MVYHISASTPDISVAVNRGDPAEAFAKVEEFEALGLTEILITAEPGGSVTREHLHRLATAAHAEAA